MSYIINPLALRNKLYYEYGFNGKKLKQFLAYQYNLKRKFNFKVKIPIFSDFKPIAKLIRLSCITKPRIKEKGWVTYKFLRALILPGRKIPELVKFDERYMQKVDASGVPNQKL